MVEKQEIIKRTFQHKNHQNSLFKKFILILFSLCIVTIGYKYYANISWVDTFYNASSISTGTLFASFYTLFSGIYFLSTDTVIFVPIPHRLLYIMHVKEEA